MPHFEKYNTYQKFPSILKINIEIHKASKGNRTEALAPNLT